MKLLVGLGNPGAQYERTRHNAGFLAVDRLARRHAPAETPRARFDSVVVETSIRGERCLLMKPTTYMNRSGQAVAAALNFFKLSPLEDLMVFVDDVALPTGAIRVRPEGSAGGHNGLTDLQRALGGDAYTRCRIGVDAKPPFMDLADYVLGRFTPEQEAALGLALEKAADAAECFVKEGVTACMNRFNAKAKPPQAEGPKRGPASGSGGAPPEAKADQA